MMMLKERFKIGKIHLFLSLTIVFVFCCLLTLATIAPAYSASYLVKLSPEASPNFFRCGTEQTYSAADYVSSLPGLNKNQSANLVLADRNPDTLIDGKAIFEISFNKNDSLVNKGGPDLLVRENVGAEPFKIAISDPTSSDQRFTAFKQFFPIRTGSKNHCNMNVNEAKIDLSSFGITDNASVSLLKFDNLGKGGCCSGADIGDITVLHYKAENKNNEAISNSSAGDTRWLGFLPFQIR